MTTFEIEPGRLFIAGQWREAADGARTEVVDPPRGAVVTTVAEAAPPTWTPPYAPPGRPSRAGRGPR